MNEECRKIETHRREALSYEEHAMHLTSTLGLVAVNSERYRRVNQQIGVSLKLAGMHAHLALALATMANTAAVPERIGAY